MIHRSTTQKRVSEDENVNGCPVAGVCVRMRRSVRRGLGPTAFGYFVQGWFKFGGVEYFKVQASLNMTPQATWENRNSIYLGRGGGYAKK